MRSGRENVRANVKDGLAEWFLALLSAISLLAGHLLRAFVRLGRMPAWIFLFIKFELLKS